MSRKPVTLWRPDDAAESDRETMERGYSLCCVSVCTEMVANPGDKCDKHRQEASLDRSPSNHRSF